VANPEFSLMDQCLEDMIKLDVRVMHISVFQFSAIDNMFCFLCKLTGQYLYASI
jgi:hypothetical protein